MTTAVKTLSAIIYNRKSRGELEDLQKFKQELITYCKKDNFNYTYLEEIASSVDKERTEYLKLLNEIKSDKYDALVITDLSRLTRNLKQQIEIFELLVEYNMVVHSLLDGIINPSDSMGELMSVIKGVFNQSAYKETSRKMHLGRLQTARKKGTWIGSAPYGYKKVKETFELERDEVEAPIVERIFKEVIEGYSTTEISLRLHRDNIKTRKGKNFHPSTVSDMLARRTYIGEKKFVSQKFNEVVYIKDNHEGIISLKDFIQVRDILANKQKFKTRTHAVTSPLDKLITCKRCGRLMQVNLASKRRYIHLQKCSAYKYGERCDNRGCSITHILPKVYIEVKKRQNVIEKQLEKLKAGSSNERLERLEKELKGITKQLKNKKTEKDDLLNFLLRKVIPESVYIEKNTAIDEEIDNLEQRENDTREAIANSNVEDDMEYLEGLLRHIENLELKPVDEQNRILKKIIDKVVYEREDNHIEMDIQFKE
ncbi:recombinase family protein [Oceanobacillus oncorhynchi subsp. oncorhynchi]|uniref:recombinase family protein n=1 Tax=Oceanobacillus oncorhynchi TaxID=545501 RepID=UPI003634D1D4